MKPRGRILLVASLVVLGVGVTLVGGAAKSAADSSGTICGTGKPICVSISGIPDPASRSPVGTDHYMTYSLEVSYANGFTSKLTNLAVTVTWADLGVPTTTSRYVYAASDQRCTETSTRTLTCTGTPKSLGPGDPPFGYGPLIFRTATTTPDNPNDVEASGTNVSVTASSKETPQPPKGGTNVSFVTTDNPTSYENLGDEDISTAGGGLTTTLATTNAGSVNQLSKLPVPASADRGIFRLSEEAAECPTGDTCFGQHVTTQAVGFAPVNLQIVYDGPLPSGATENSIGVIHARTVGGTVVITAVCPSATPTLAEVEALHGCRLVDVSPGAKGSDKHVEISAWDISNGGWQGT
jgi:hypothetical protein